MTVDDEAVERLVDAARAGDPEAFGLLFDRYHGPVRRYVAARVGRPSDAEDLAQLVFVKALEAIPRYESRGVPFGGWLFRLARNVVIDHIRTRRDHITLDLAAERPSRRGRPGRARGPAPGARQRRSGAAPAHPGPARGHRAPVLRRPVGEGGGGGHGQTGRHGPGPPVPGHRSAPTGSRHRTGLGRAADTGLGVRLVNEDELQALEPRAGEELDRTIARYVRVRLDPTAAETRRVRAAVMEEAWRRRFATPAAAAANEAAGRRFRAPRAVRGVGWTPGRRGRRVRADRRPARSAPRPSRRRARAAPSTTPGWRWRTSRCRRTRPRGWRRSWPRPRAASLTSSKPRRVATTGPCRPPCARTGRRWPTSTRSTGRPRVVRSPPSASTRSCCRTSSRGCRSRPRAASSRPWTAARLPSTTSTASPAASRPPSRGGAGNPGNNGNGNANGQGERQRQRGNGNGGGNGERRRERQRSSANGERPGQRQRRRDRRAPGQRPGDRERQRERPATAIERPGQRQHAAGQRQARQDAEARELAQAVQDAPAEGAHPQRLTAAPAPCAEPRQRAVGAATLHR